MEDAMILNKSSMERGLAHGTIVKCENINLRVRGALAVAMLLGACTSVRIHHRRVVACCWRCKFSASLL
jgi:hypothetical protein